MSLSSGAAAICLSLSIVASSGKNAGTLINGGTYSVLPDPSVPSAVVELWFRAPAAGYDEATPGLSRVAATAVAASERLHGTSLAELTRNLGGSLTINAYSDVVSIAASAPAASSRALVRALTAAYFTPTVSANGFRSAVRDEAVAIEEKTFEPHLALREMLFAQLFREGPAHYALTPDSTDALAALSAERVNAFAARAFRPQNAILTLAGNVVAADVAVAAAGPPGAAMDAPFDSQTASPGAAVVKTGSLDGVGLGWIGPPIVQTRAATALDFVANYLFDPLSGTVSRALVRDDPAASVEGQFITLHAPGILMVTISGGSRVRAKDGVLQAVTALSQPLPSQTFEAARRAFAYRIAADTATAQAVADNAGWYAAENDPSYAPGDPSGTYAQNVASLNPKYVAQIVREYLQHPAIAELRAEHAARR